MQEIICDICKTAPSCTKIKVKISRKGFRANVGSFWTPWEQIDICENCGKDILKTINYDPNGAPKPALR